MPEDVPSDAESTAGGPVTDAEREPVSVESSPGTEGERANAAVAAAQRTQEDRRPKTPAPRPRSGRQVARQWVAAFGLLLFLGCALGLVFEAPSPMTAPVAGPSPAPGPRLSVPTGVVVVLDPGHGGADTGAVALGMVEKELTLDIARRVATALERQRVAIRLTRDTDRYVPLAARARFANALPNSVFVSIHLNHATNAPASGIETFYTERKEPLLAWNRPVSGRDSSPGLWQWLAQFFGAPSASAPAGSALRDGGAGAGEGITESRALAGCIQAKLVSRTAATDRGVKERGLYVTRHVAGPAVLVEGGFVTNPAEARSLADPAYRQRVAESIADGIVEYLAEAASRARVPPKNVLAIVE